MNFYCIKFQKLIFNNAFIFELPKRNTTRLGKKIVIERNWIVTNLVRKTLSIIYKCILNNVIKVLLSHASVTHFILFKPFGFIALQHLYYLAIQYIDIERT